MALRKVKFAPGVNKEGTDYTADQGWVDSDKIRFRQGNPEKIGGWQKYLLDSFEGVCRSLHAWSTLSSVKHIGVGTNLKFYITEGNSYKDVTPLRATTSAGDVTFAASNGSSTLTVTDSGHGAVVNDFVTFSGAASLGGLIIASALNQEYQIASVSDVNTYTVTAKDTSGDTLTANASDSGNGGGSVVGAYQINTGLNAFIASQGWGADGWGFGGFGSSTAISSGNQLRLFSQDNFGEDLIFNVRGGGIYYSDVSAGLNNRAVNITALSGASDAPTVALQIMVSDTDQHVIAFGCNAIGSSTIDPLFVRFSTQESAKDWTPTATNTAGGIRINSGSLIVGAVQSRQEIIVFTDRSVHSMRFVGGAFIFELSLISTDVSMISPNAAIDVGGQVYFMDEGGFYVYNGSVQTLPCSVKNHVFSNLNKSQAYKVFAAENSAYSEVTWFYPVGTGNTEITNYVTYDYAENLWSIGTLERGAWNDYGTGTAPLAASVITSSNANYLYEHETGHDDDGSAMTAYIESGDLEINDGESFMFVNRIIPDFTFSGADPEVNLTLKGRNYPLQSTTTLSSATVNQSTTESHVRARARHPVLRIESSGTGYGWRLGTLRFQIRQDGRR
jgi:hypothetical protein|tara:strand:- start:325 stop:2172 length:1848 start_codon:yes stop_codon:yes gene_type:complete